MRKDLIEYYKKNYNDNQLKFVINDCYDAIKAFPEGYKTSEYLEIARSLDLELVARHSKRTFRKALKRTCIDPLSVPVRKYRNRIIDVNKEPFTLSSLIYGDFRNACFFIGCDKLARKRNK